MTKLEEFKLESLRRRLGNMSPDDALALAIQCEQYAHDCGPMDPATEMFIQERITFETYAYLLAEAEAI